MVYGTRKTGKESFLSRMSLTNILIIITVAFYFLFLIIIAISPTFFNYIAILPSNILQGKAIWTILSSIFMHANFLHLFVNMFSLFFLGNLTERIIGKKRMLWFYLIAGLAGGLAFVLFAYWGTFIGNGVLAARVFGGVDSSAVGASGALFGLLGVLAVLIPRQKVYLVLGPLILIIVQVMLDQIIPSGVLPVFDFVFTALIFLTVFAMFSSNPKFRRISLPAGMPLWLTPIVAIVPLVLISLFVSLPIGNTAHFGGLLAGLVYGLYLRAKYQKKVNMLQRYFR